MFNIKKAQRGLSLKTISYEKLLNLGWSYIMQINGKDRETFTWMLMFYIFPLIHIKDKYQDSRNWFNNSRTNNIFDSTSMFGNNPDNLNYSDYEDFFDNNFATKTNSEIISMYNLLKNPARMNKYEKMAYNYSNKMTLYYNCLCDDEYDYTFEKIYNSIYNYYKVLVRTRHNIKVPKLFKLNTVFFLKIWIEHVGSTWFFDNYFIWYQKF